MNHGFAHGALHKIPHDDIVHFYARINLYGPEAADKIFLDVLAVGVELEYF